MDANVRIDQGQLDQVLFNLVLNGRDAMTQKGTIVIETTPVDGGAVALAVTDTGVGMDEATLALCREPFFTTKGRRGIGLGLATVGTIVERAGGRLQIDSVPGQGTTVTVILPVAIDSAPTAPEASPPHSARVLLVDDDDLIRRYASEVLTNAGYDVVSVGDAETALVTIENGRFDLLVSDVVLPGMSGFELASTVEQRWPAMALLLMTGFFGTDTRGTDLADVEVLSKPFSIDALRRAADRAVVAVRQDSNR
jgi:CheY-like chemotaxis protein